MIDIIDKKDCCGCWACKNICPKGCIVMTEDNEGFRYPRVDMNNCIGCELCEKVCPIINVKLEVKNESQKGFLLQIKDEQIRNESTSGGAFTAISSWVLSNGGVVFGASMNLDEKRVEHTWVETIDGLKKFRNSKYVQSDMYESFSSCKKFLDEDRWVCFSGTPCQIEGLKHFLRKEYEKLVTIDVVCYGIPSPGLFKNYLVWKQKVIGGHFSKILFREKRLCYNYTSFSIYNDDKTRNYHKGVESEQFMRSFFSNMNVRPSCYDCRFKKRYRNSDFTIWDCYDVKMFSEKFDDNGTNRVLVHSLLGERIMDKIMPFVKLEQYENIDFFIADEIAMVKSVPLNIKREQFFSDYAQMDMETLMYKWFPITMKVRINSFLRKTAFKLGIYNTAKRLVKKIFKR